MRNKEYFLGKQVVIVGLARSGLSCARLLSACGAQVRVTDHTDSPATRAAARLLRAASIPCELGKHTRAFIKGSDLVVISPGVPESAAAIVWAKKLHIPVISEIEVGWMLCPAPVIAVTGSSGKTTVTTLIGLILESACKRAFVCGNIGNPFTGEVAKMSAGDYAVLEVSSFQLEHIRTFRPSIALVTNVSRNHLDRYAGMRQYIAAKQRIYRNQTRADRIVLNGRDPAMRSFARSARSRKVFFKADKGLNPNQAAVVAVGALLGIDARACRKVFARFQGLKHRMEEVATVRGVRFINDSKATTVESAIWALESIAGPVILIAGGRDKGVDYRLLLKSARSKVKEAIIIGEARAKIRKAWAGELALSEADSLEQAVRQAFVRARRKDVVLLSPMCSSYDMFDNYEARGEAFRKAVKALSAGR